MSLHPDIGARVFVRPTCPSVRVQRGQELYNAFLPPEGAEVLWDEFLLRRLEEGVIEWRPIAPPARTPKPADKETA